MSSFDLDDLLIDQDLSWWLYQLPDGREVRVDVDRPLRFRIDVQDGEQASGLTTEQVESKLRALAGGIRAGACPPLPPPVDLAAELGDRGDGGHASPCKTPSYQWTFAPGLLVCCIPCRSGPGTEHTSACNRRHTGMEDAAR